jgi:phage shock protein C
MNGRLYRSRRDRVLAGVAGGLADYLDIDPSLVRVTWAILTLFSGGALLLVYILMAIIVPEEPAGAGRSYAMESGQTSGSGSSATGDSPDSADTGSAVATRSEWGRGSAASDDDRYRWGRRERRGSGGLVVGVILIVIGGIFLVREYVPALDWDRLWPIILIAVGVVLLLAAIGGRDRRSARP